MVKLANFIALSLVFLIGCTPNASTTHKKEEPSEVKAPKEEKKLETLAQIEEEKVYQFYFTPSVREDILRKNAVKIVRYLTEETGIKFYPVIPNSYKEVIDGFATEKADLAMINSFGYIIANEKYGAHAKLRSVRAGKSTYKGQLIVGTNSDIHSLKDLNGKKVAYTNPTSASGYLLPHQMIKEEMAVPGQVVFAQKHDAVVEMVYNGTVDAGATYYTPAGVDGIPQDARAQVLDQYPDVMEKIKILTLTEPIPNDPIVFSATFPKKIESKVVLALKKFILTEEGKAIFLEMYGIEDFVKSTDQDFNTLKKAVMSSVENMEQYAN